MNRTLLIWALPIVASLFSTSLSAQSVNVRLTVMLGKSQVQLGEPVYMTATLTNTGAGEADVYPSLYPEDSALQVNVRAPDGESRVFVPYSLDLNEASTKRLMPGESIGAAFPIFYGGRGWTFTDPGTYQVSARVIA